MSSNLCSQCHKRNPIDGKKCCQLCLDRASNRRWINKSRGLCDCGKKTLSGEKMCQQCRTRKNAYRLSNPESTKQSQRKTVYGITNDQYQYMIDVHNNRCAICKVEFSEDSKNTKIHIDHDHSTNTVRGLLCGDCNLGLGRFKDNTELLLEAINYLNYYAIISESRI